VKPKGISGIRDRHLQEQLRLRSERTSGRIFRKALVLDGYHEAESQPFSQVSKNECEDFVEGSAPSETKEETAHRI
jgi:hypothetical protein